MKIKIDASKIKMVTKDVGTAIGFIGGLITIGIILGSNYTDFLRYNQSINNTNNINNSNNSNDLYYEVIKNVLDSDMWDSDKEDLLDIIPRDESSYYYNIVIQILNSDAFDSTKVECIKNITKDN